MNGNKDGEQPTTYIVSGFGRCGTSMMMRALIDGGMTAYYDESADDINRIFGDEEYKPNGAGFFEFKIDVLMKTDFPKDYEGYLIKVLQQSIIGLYPGKYKIIYLLRDKEEIRQSFEAFLGRVPKPWNRYDEITEKVIKIMGVRKDVEYILLWYRDIVENPKEAFQKIKDFGFPIDVDKASAVVDPNKVRFKRENLVDGL